MITQPTKIAINGAHTATKLHQINIIMIYLLMVDKIINTQMMKPILRMIILKVIISIQDMKIRNFIAIKIIKNMPKITAMLLSIENILIFLKFLHISKEFYDLVR